MQWVRFNNNMCDRRLTILYVHYETDQNFILNERFSRNTRVKRERNAQKVFVRLYVEYCTFYLK